MTKQDWIYGYCLLGSLVGLALVIGPLGKSEELTSHGLMPIIVAIAGLAGAWGTKAFGTKNAEKIG